MDFVNDILVDIGVWYIAFLIHLLAACIYYLVLRRFTTKIQAVTETTIVFLIPVFGIIILTIGRSIYRLLYKGNDPQAHKLSNKNTIFTSMTTYDENVIPLNDTFLVDDVKRKRRVFLDAVKQNVLQNPKVLRLATHDSDREIAYYAVSMLSTRIETLESAMSESENKLQQTVNQNNLSMLSIYGQQLSEYINQDFVDPLTRRDKRKVYLEIINRLMTEEAELSDDMRRYYYGERLKQEMELEMFEDAEKTCSEMQLHFPDDEASYMGFIRLYHAMRDPQKLHQKIAEMKERPIRLSTEALRVIRYWGGRSGV